MDVTIERIAENMIEHVACRLNRYFSHRIFDIVHGYAENRTNRRDKAMVALAKAVQPAWAEIQKQHESLRPKVVVVEDRPDINTAFFGPGSYPFNRNDMGYVN